MSTASSRVVVDLDVSGPTISRHLYGHFAEHLGRCIYGGFYVGADSDLPNEGGIRSIYWLILGFTGFIFLLVEVALVVFIVRYRSRGRGREVEGPPALGAQRRARIVVHATDADGVRVHTNGYGGEWLPGLLYIG